MNSNKTGWLFLSIVLCFIAVELVVGFTPLGDSLSVPAMMLISELTFMLPVGVCFLFSGSSAAECFALRTVKPSVAFLSIPYTWMVLPLTMTLNIFTLFFTNNRASEIMETLSGAGLFLMALFTALIGPICEELTFRGIIFAGIRKSGSALQAIFISALLFGLFHMNINQALYAFGLGLFFGALREVTGSIIPSIICHITVNSGGVISLLIQKLLVKEQELPDAVATGALDNNTLAMALAVGIIMAFIGVAIALCLLAYIARRQGNIRAFKDIVAKRESSKGEVWSVPLVSGSLLAVAFMIFLMVFELIRASRAA